MNKAPLTRGALLGAACFLLAAGSAAAQTYPPGTNCQSLLPTLRAACVDQARQLNSGVGVNGSNTVIPNSAGSNTVPTPGTNLNSGTTVLPNSVTPNGVVSPNTVTPNGTVSPNAVTPNGTVNPNAVGTPNAAPTNPVIVPPAGTGTSGN